MSGEVTETRYSFIHYASMSLNLSPRNLWPKAWFWERERKLMEQGGLFDNSCELQHNVRRFKRGVKHRLGPDRDGISSGRWRERAKHCYFPKARISDWIITITILLVLTFASDIRSETVSHLLLATGEKKLTCLGPTENAEGLWEAERTSVRETFV